MGAAVWGIVGAVVVGPLAALSARRWIATHASDDPPPATLAVAVVTGVVFAAAAWHLGGTWRLGPVLVGAAGIVAAAAVDLACHRVPTPFVVGTGAAALAVATTVAAGPGPAGALGAGLLGAAIYGGFTTAVHLLAPEGLGGGDARLGWLVGGVVGWATWSPGGNAVTHVVTVVTASVLASVAIGLVTHLVRSSNHQAATALPFAPAIGAGALVVLLLGPAGSL